MYKLFLFFLIFFAACTPDIGNSKFDTSMTFSDVDWDTCGYNIGDHACDFVRYDQNGEPWRLYSYYKNTELIVIDFSAMWCGPCRAAAERVPTILSGDHDVDWATVLVSNMAGEIPTQEDQLEWAEIYQHDCAVLSSEGTLRDIYPITVVPTFYLVDGDMIIRQKIEGFLYPLFLLQMEYILEGE